MINSLLKKFDIQTNNPELYQRAFTHSSYANEHKTTGTYQRLEFLGDAVIDLLVADFLFKSGNKNESEMSTTRIMAVREETLNKASNLIGLDKYILLGNKTPLTDKIMCDVFESFIGALYSDNQDNVLIHIMNKTIFKFIEENDFSNVIDYKTRLQEIVQSSSKKTLKYISEKNENNLWNAILMIGSVKMSSGEGNTKKKAEQNAAKACLELNM